MAVVAVVAVVEVAAVAEVAAVVGVWVDIIMVGPRMLCENGWSLGGCREIL